MDKIFGSQPDSGAAGADAKTPAPAPTPSWTSSPYAQIGLPLLAGVVSAASPVGARGVQGATHIMSAMNRDPYGYKALAAQGKVDTIAANKAKQEDNQRMFDQNRQFRGVMTQRYPDYAAEIAAIPDKDLFPMSQKLMERPTDSEYSIAATAVLPKGTSHRNLSPEQANAVMEKVKANRVDTTAQKAFETQVIKIDMPLPSRGGKGGPPESKYAMVEDANGNWDVRLGPDGKPILKSQMVTPTTPTERATTAEDKDKAAADKLERDAVKQDRKDARENLRDSFQFKMLPAKKQEQLLESEIKKVRERRLKGQGAPAPASSATPPAADPLGWR